MRLQVALSPIALVKIIKMRETIDGDHWTVWMLHWYAIWYAFLCMIPCKHKTPLTRTCDYAWIREPNAVGIQISWRNCNKLRVYWNILVYSIFVILPRFQTDNINWIFRTNPIFFSKFQVAFFRHTTYTITVFFFFYGIFHLGWNGQYNCSSRIIYFWIQTKENWWSCGVKCERQQQAGEQEKNCLFNIYWMIERWIIIA